MRRLAGVVGVILVGALVASLCGCGATGPPADRATDAAAAGVSFVVFGDNRPRQGEPQPGVFVGLVKQMASYNPDFALATGDYIWGNTSSQDVLRAQWEGFLAVLAPLQAGGRPVYFAPGNHEIADGAGRRLFLVYCPPANGHLTYFSFDRGGAHFVVLDTEIPGQEQRIAGRQLMWLRQDLANAAQAPPHHLFVALHEPLYPVSVHRGESLDAYPNARNALHRLFVRYRVTAVFQGHEHLYNRQVRSGVAYYICGGAGAEPHPDPNLGGRLGSHHFLYVEADATRCQVSVVRVK